ncbi:alpha/beta fold hydrolase [Radiobacillus sp. PE A8.2]|uniref:alpha/beta fold hydrolase n=1 Tax=Radiobacillus sp. PE A8.2 TaxID=3380349 RepID=UPI00388F5A6D
MLLHTEMFGDGEAVVFLHTGLQSGMTDFEHQREYFKHNYKVFVPDLRGHGKSETTDFSNYFEDCAQDLLETLDFYKLNKVHLVGCSLGAIVGLFFAKRNADRIKTLTLSGILHKKPDNWLEMHKEDVEFQAQLLQDEETVNYFNSVHAADWKQFIYMGREENWYPFEETGDVAAINFPTLYMVGEGNKAETKGAISYPQLNDHIHVSIIPFASHLVHSQQPEIYTRILEVFMEEGNS